MSAARSLYRCEVGVASIEGAIVLLAYTFLIFGIMELLYVLFAYSTVARGAENAARYAMVHNACSVTAANANVAVIPGYYHCLVRLHAGAGEPAKPRHHLPDGGVPGNRGIYISVVFHRVARRGTSNPGDCLRSTRLLDPSSRFGGTPIEAVAKRHDLDRTDHCAPTAGWLRTPKCQQRHHEGAVRRFRTVWRIG